MSAYCSIDNVRGWLPQGQTLDDQTNVAPTATTVTAWITDFSGILDSVFGATTDADYLLARKTYLARELAYQVMAVRSSSEDKTAPALFIGWHDEWKALFDDPEAGAGVVGSPADSGIASSYTMDADDSPDSSVNPVFQRDQAHNW